MCHATQEITEEPCDPQQTFGEKTPSRGGGGGEGGGFSEDPRVPAESEESEDPNVPIESKDPRVP